MTITGITDTLDQINQRNAALISGISAQTSQMATASAARQLTGITGALDQINQRNAALASGISAQASQMATASAARQLTGITGALDQINQRNAALISEVGTRASDTAFLASQRQLTSGITASIEQINKRNNALVAGVVEQMTSWARTLPKLDIDGLGARVTSQIAADALRSLGTCDVYRVVAEVAGVAEPSVASRSLIERLDRAQLSPLARQRAVVSLVWLIVFVTMFTLAAEYFDEAKVLSILIGSGAYPLAKDAAGAAHRAMQWWDGVE